MQGDFRLVQRGGGQSRYVRAGHKKEWPWNMMHDTRTRHCLGKLLSISGVNQGKGARSRPRTMGAWVSNASSNDTGAPPIEAYINANVPVYAYIITYILTSLSFCLFLFPPLPPLLSVPFFSLERIQWVHMEDRGLCLEKKARWGKRSLKCNRCSLVCWNWLKLPDRRSVCSPDISFLLIVSS